MSLFESDIPQWLVQKHGGQGGTLDDCLEVLFDHIPAKKMPATYSAVKNRCLEVGYVSIHGWTVCFVADEGESTI
jgi:hypothetical protein